MLVNKNYVDLLGEMTGNGNNMDFAAFSQTEIMQEFIDDLVIDMLNDAGANIEKNA